ncbi:MAG: class I SAM-dependent methyltransferase [Steroidobacteraceae bacterium]
MSLGATVRRVLGPRLARRAGGWYRAIFVDLGKVAAAIAGVIPRGAHLLDIGGGDGQPLNYLLALRPDLRVTTLDPGPLAGQWIDARFDAQVTRLPGTGIAEYLAAGRADPDAILIADVMHHLPESSRASFLRSIRVLLERVPKLRIIVKDVEPGSWRALLGFWADRYITGDRDVGLISRDRLERLVIDALGPLRREDTDLFKTDPPNYAIAFHR